MNLRPVDVENCDMGACAKSWFYTQWGRRVDLRQAEAQYHTFICLEKNALSWNCPHSPKPMPKKTITTLYQYSCR